MHKELQPRFDLRAIKNLVKADSYHVTLRVSNYLINHGFDPKETIAGVINAAKSEYFQKSIRLDKLPGQFADVYSGIPYCCERWYLKLYMDDQALQVHIWSLNIDGMIH